MSWPSEQARHDEAALIAERLHAVAGSGQWRSYSGPALASLELALQQTFHRTDVHLTSSGTIAVELALRAVGVQAGDDVALAGYDFPGNFRAIEAIGARPVLYDLAPSSWSVGERALAQILADRPRAVLVSHLHGSQAPLDQWAMPLKEAGIQVVEDACQAPGATLGGQVAGSFGAASVLSFGGSKLLSAGRGGAVLTNDPQIAQRLKILNDRGNLAYPLSELQAAVLEPQLQFLAARHAARFEALRQLRSEIASYAAGQALALTDGIDHQRAHYKIPLTVADRTTRDHWLHQLTASGVHAGEPFRGFWKRSGNRCRVAEPLGESQRASEQTLLLSCDFLEDVDRFAQMVSALKRL